MERNKGRESEKGGKVMLERYGRILSLLSSFDVESLCNDISSLLSFDWFYGERETKEISMALSQKPNGTFCVRFSNNPARKSCYVLFLSPQKIGKGRTKEGKDAIDFGLAFSNCSQE